MKKETLEEILYLKMENNEENNIFNNLNNFSRDKFVFDETVKICMFFLEDLIEEKNRYQKGMQDYYQQLQYYKHKKSGR